jgi:hypothetical protein
MATVDVREKRINEQSRMSQLGRFITESGLVVLDTPFPENLVAKRIHVGTAGNLRVLTPYTNNGAPTFSVVLNAEIGYHDLICTMVTTTGTTAGNLTWHTGE